MAVKMRYGSGKSTAEPLQFQGGFTDAGITLPSGVTLVNGGYIRSGTLVIVNMRLSFTAAFGVNTNVLTGLPKPANIAGVGSTTALLPVAAASSSTWAMRANGAIYTREAITSGTNVVLMTVYITDD